MLPKTRNPVQGIYKGETGRAFFGPCGGGCASCGACWRLSGCGSPRKAAGKPARSPAGAALRGCLCGRWGKLLKYTVYFSETDNFCHPEVSQNDTACGRKSVAKCDTNSAEIFEGAGRGIGSILRLLFRSGFVGVSGVFLS